MMSLVTLSVRFFVCPWLVLFVFLFGIDTAHSLSMR